MKIWMYRIFISLIINCFFISQAQAAGKFYNSNLMNKSAGHDYISGAQAGDVLIKVNLWGAVHQPGIHSIPAKTDLLTLLSYAGGPTDKAILDEVTIKRDLGSSRKLIRVDMEALVKGSSHHHIDLAPNDVIVVPAKDPLISQDTLAVVGLSSLILSTILTAILIDRNNNK
jgi:hypothetical protein